jgi:hypothetical protein
MFWFKNSTNVINVWDMEHILVIIKNEFPSVRKHNASVLQIRTRLSCMQKHSLFIQRLIRRP